MLGEHFQILTGKPLKELDLDGAPAYAARDLRSTDRLLFARICAPDVLPRIYVMNQLRSANEARLISPLEWGTISDADGKTRFAIAFNRPPGKPMMPDLTSRLKPMSAEAIVERVLTPIAYTLQRFDQRKINHGDIRPTKLFYGEAESGAITMGDCVAVPAGWMQHPAFLTIESMMTPREAVGEGSIDDDLYALGATILFLSLGCCPVASVDRATLIKRKLDRGSFQALIGDELPPMGLREPLRGLLDDHRENRWRLDDLVLWLSGALRRTIKPVDHVKPDRPYEFLDEKFTSIRGLADSFGQHWQEADKEVRTSGFLAWLRRAVSDFHLADRVAAVVENSAGEGSPTGTTDLVTRVCNRLDPGGPIRFRGLVLKPEGLGYLLYLAIRSGDQQAIRRLVDYINSGTLADWFESFDTGGRADLEPEVKHVRRLQQYLRHSGPGLGVERCLYELSGSAPCLSPMLEGYYVSSLADLLPALEDVVARKGSLSWIVDRHIVAYISAHFRKPIGTHLNQVEEGGGSSVQAKLGMVGILARVQAQEGPASLPKLTEWLAGELGSAANRYKSKTTRAEVKKRLPKIAGSGSLWQLYAVLNNERLLKREEAACNAALREFASLTKQIEKLESTEFQESAQRRGWQIAAGISMGVAFATIGSLALG